MTELYEPRYPLIWYGDGHWAQLRNKIEVRNEEGVLGWMMILNPSRELISEYGISKKDLDDLGFIKRWYPKSVIKILRDDPVVGKILIKTDFDGGSTDLTRETAEYIEMIQDQEKLIDALRAGKARLLYELKLAMAQPKAYLTAQANLFETIKKKTSGSGEDMDSEYPGFEAPSNE